MTDDIEGREAFKQTNAKLQSKIFERNGLQDKLDEATAEIRRLREKLARIRKEAAE